MAAERISQADGMVKSIRLAERYCPCSSYTMRSYIDSAIPLQRLGDGAEIGGSEDGSHAGLKPRREAQQKEVGAIVVDAAFFVEVEVGITAM